MSTAWAFGPVMMTSECSVSPDSGIQENHQSGTSWQTSWQLSLIPRGLEEHYILEKSLLFMCVIIATLCVYVARFSIFIYYFYFKLFPGFENSLVL